MTAAMAEQQQHKKNDIVTLATYVKKDLYPKVKFFYDEKVELKVGGQIYNDYWEKCKNQMQGGARLGSDLLLDTYMESIWNQGLTEKTQRKALSARRSAVYTVMQNKFTGTSYSVV